MEKHALGEAIRRRRRAAGLTLGQVAVKVGISKTAISKIERGLTEDPGILTVIGIAQALDTTPDSLLIEGALLDPPPNNKPWSRELIIMQRLLNLYPPDSSERQHLENIIIAQAEAYLALSGREEPNEQV